MYLADTLSRAYLPTEEEPEKRREKVQTIAQQSSSMPSTTTIEVAETKQADYFPISEPTLKKIQEASKEDPTFKQLKSFIHKG